MKINMMKTLLRFLTALFILPVAVHAQDSVQVLSKGTKTSLRGICPVNDDIIWVSGSNGMVGRSTDGGQNWKWVTVKGFERSDFRDIEAFDASTAVIIAVGEPAYILRTKDGGNSWRVVYENKTKGMFLDAIEFWNEISGAVIGDPVNGHFFVARSFDGGNTWREVAATRTPRADSGEACFAASGTNIRKISKNEAVFVSGGMKSRLFKRDKILEMPVLQGTESSGANSIAVRDKNHFIVVGGDFSAPQNREKNCAITSDGGLTWKPAQTPPFGYRSCVEYLGRNDLISCGLTGVDLSTDGGFNWKNISTEGFHACRRANKGKIMFLAGENGKIGKVISN